jgi:hypothetical protein
MAVNQDCPTVCSIAHLRMLSSGADTCLLHSMFATGKLQSQSALLSADIVLCMQMLRTNAKGLHRRMQP